MAHDEEGAVLGHITDQRKVIPSPEKEMMKFIATIVILDWMASGLGIVKSLWATMLGKNYLGFITLIILFQCIHIICHISKLLLYQMHNMQHLPNPICAISRLFHWLEIFSVITSGFLSVVGLAYLLRTDDKQPKALVLYVFYAMAISEVLVFLVARAIWNVRYCRLLKKVEDELKLDESGMDLIKRFFYGIHCKCVENWNIIDALEMDQVTFAGDLLLSSSGEMQLMAASYLKSLSTHPKLCDAALCKIGTSNVVIERLIQMLNSENLFDENIRKFAAVIVSKLADKEPNVRRVAGMDEAMKLAIYLMGAT